MPFSKQFIEEIKSRNPVEDTVSRFVPLKRAGSNLVGICPFHSEKSPSFTVFPATDSYYCFGCGAGGDIFTFVMNTEGLDYREAVEQLALKSGIPMEEDDTHTDYKPAVKKERIYEINKEAGRFFFSALLSEAGLSAREYLKNRQISDITIKRFGIGYAPDSWDSLYLFLKHKGFSELELKTAFLCGESKNGRIYDIFRNRIMFPVFDVNNECVAFSGRRLNEADDRKYINTSDTPAFKKSKVIFGLNIAKKHSDGTLILCEGAVDAIALHQAGFPNAIATLGTAITSEHSRIIARFAKTVFIAYDIDKAGRNATEKAINILNDVGVATKILSLGTDAKDPDEFIKKFGKEAFSRVLNASDGQIEYQIKSILSKYVLTIPEDKLRAANEIYSYISKLSNKTEREVYISSVAAKLELGKQTIAEEVERRVRYLAKKQKTKLFTGVVSEQEGFGDRVNKDKIKFSAAALTEERILGIMLTRPDSAHECVGLLSEDDFLTEFNRKLYMLFKKDFELGTSVTLSKDGILSSDEVSAASRMMAGRMKLNDNGSDTLTALIAVLKEEKHKHDADIKISQNPVEGLEEYIANLRNKKTEDING